MSRVYDNWERLVAATLKREEFRRLCLDFSPESSFCSRSSSFSSSSRLREVFDDFRRPEDIIKFQSNLYAEHGFCPNCQDGCNCSFQDEPYDDGTSTDQTSRVPTTKKSSRGLKMGSLFDIVGITKLVKTRQREKFFKQNMVLLLKISSKLCGFKPPKMFSAQELEIATNWYSEDYILRRGGFGTVFRGILYGQSDVAIKKPRAMDESQAEQYVNELIILTQVNHRNVVKLLGCCLETEVPLLVYEFIPNDTLFYQIHRADELARLSWENRLRIATEAAGALAYLHSAAYVPIIHRDFKSNNILLDEQYSAKITDFGISKQVPLDQDCVTTTVIGTLGYLDPEYFNSGQLTEKADVYSFGVVLAELMTGRRPISPTESEDQRNLAPYFVMSMKENQLLSILEPKILTEASPEELQAVGELASRCLRWKSCERPTMKEVVFELEGLIIKFPRHSPARRESNKDTSMSLKFGSLYEIFGIRKLFRVRKREKFYAMLPNNYGIETPKLFSAEELKKATNSYSENHILGMGFSGTVYRGLLHGQLEVAIKKSAIMDESQVEQFITEVIVLSRVNHRNVVKLLGCCLETEVPLLVYEHIPNGTLCRYIRDTELAWLSWEHRIRIAAETAQALAYLHSAASMSIIHGDVNPSNILLDEQYTAKVIDCGASKTMPLGQDHVTTRICGTFGYLDPEFFQSGQLTQKADVYSFGVVLAELMTGRQPFSPSESEGERGLAPYFVMSVKENQLLSILEPQILNEASLEELQAVGELAKRCLNLNSNGRPTMREVSLQLEDLIKKCHAETTLVQEQALSQTDLPSDGEH